MNALVIFAKFPDVGKVKKKIGAKIGMDVSAKLCECFIKDLIKEHEQRDYDLYLSFIGREYKEKYRVMFPNAILYVQRGHNLSENLFFMFEDLLDDYERVVVIGMDVPDLHTDYVQNAFAELDSYDIVIGPADDGGYCLIGLNNSTNIFKDLPWGSPELLESQINSIKNKGLTFFKLDSLPDVDDVDELILLKKRLKRDEAPCTFDLLPEISI